MKITQSRSRIGQARSGEVDVTVEQSKLIVPSGRNGQRLHDFTLGPAPDGSLDAILASAGFPIMALDVGTPPKQPVAADWLEAPHQTWSIGAVFSNDQAANYLLNAAAPEMFDVLVFVEKTTAAQKITPAESK